MNTQSHLILRSLAAGLLFAPALAGETTGQDELTKKYEAKLAKPFVEFGGWVTDYDEARARAEEEGKVLFVYFSRSYSP